MKFLVSVKECTRDDRIKNGDIGNKLAVRALRDMIENYKENLKLHVIRMENRRYPKANRTEAYYLFYYLIIIPNILLLFILTIYSFIVVPMYLGRRYI